MADALGLSCLLDQVKHRAIKRGFHFTLMVVGESGLGKTTLINTLFNREVIRISEENSQTCSSKSPVEEHTVLIEEGDVKLNLTILDTPGFGVAIDNGSCWVPIVKEIESRFLSYLEMESSAVRPVPDYRVHCCLYLLPPSSRCLRPLDVIMLRRLQLLVNIIPVIAKGDTLTVSERQRIKKCIQQELIREKIRVFRDGLLNDIYGTNPFDFSPFAVVGGSTKELVDGQTKQMRVYPWGKVEVDNPAHTDVYYLRNLLIRSHTLDLVEATSSLYERFRLHCLQRAQLSGVLTKSISDIQIQEDEHGVPPLDKNRSEFDLFAGIMKNAFRQSLRSLSIAEQSGLGRMDSKSLSSLIEEQSEPSYTDDED